MTTDETFAGFRARVIGKHATDACNAGVIAQILLARAVKHRRLIQAMGRKCELALVEAAALRRAGTTTPRLATHLESLAESCSEVAFSMAELLAIARKDLERARAFADEHAQSAQLSRLEREEREPA